MTRAEFHELFLRSLNKAAELADRKVGHTISRSYKIEFHGLGHSGNILDIAQAEALLYVGSDLFFKIIDVMITGVSTDRSFVFIRPSGHAAVEWKETWEPGELGPFKLLEADNIEEGRTAR